MAVIDYYRGRIDYTCHEGSTVSFFYCYIPVDWLLLFKSISEGVERRRGSYDEAIIKISKVTDFVAHHPRLPRHHCFIYSTFIYFGLVYGAVVFTACEEATRRKRCRFIRLNLPCEISTSERIIKSVCSSSPPMTFFPCTDRGPRQPLEPC